MIHKITDRSDPRLRLPALYNVYPVFNEVHASSLAAESGLGITGGEHVLDDMYGRVFNAGARSAGAVYGRTDCMEHYVKLDGLKVVDELRVPYRRVPVYEAQNKELIASCIEQLTLSNSDHTILIRGQGKNYFIERDSEDSEFFYGGNVQEPSFLPSFLRADYDELEIQSIWHCQAALLLNDVGFDYQSILPTDQQRDYWNDVTKLRRMDAFNEFALGIAQHYGLPSLGLDLTDNIDVALWFALNTIAIDKKGTATCSPIDSSASPTVFIFRCPTDSVFDYQNIRPHQFPVARPDRQNAWFAHVGWGCSENQLGSFLMCGFRLRAEQANDLPRELVSRLFPKLDDDPILKFFLAMKNMQKYEGEALRALQRIYLFE
jgi:hypothetical protein